MSAAMPNPFCDHHHEPSADSPLSAEPVTAPTSDASDAVALSSPSRFEPDMDRLYADIMQTEPLDLPPLFLRKPSAAFMRALFRLGDA